MTTHEAQNEKFLWQRASMPLVFSICAFICFAILYLMFTQAINPIYLLLGLFLAVPALILFCIALLAGKNKLQNSTTVILTIILVPVLIIVSFFYTFILGLSLTSETTTKVSLYERTMRLGGYSQKEQLAAFPKKIPNGATNAAFYYTQSSWQEYDQTVVLSFSASKELIDEYAKQFERIAIKTENANETIIESVFDRVGENYIKDLSADYVVYVLINEGFHDRKVSAVSVSQEKKHIIFYAYEMRW